MVTVTRLFSDPVVNLAKVWSGIVCVPKMAYLGKVPLPFNQRRSVLTKFIAT